MKVTKIVLVVVVAWIVINAVSRGYDFKLPMVLPFMGGKGKPYFYEVAGVVMILIMLWGLRRLGRNS
jgi:hypothetical protein